MSTTVGSKNNYISGEKLITTVCDRRALICEELL